MHIPQVAYDAALKAFLDRPHIPMKDRIEIAVDVAIEVAEEDKALQRQAATDRPHFPEEKIT